jgi:hypothetical protein
MIRPNDLPLVCLPEDLCDQAAAQLFEFLQELTLTFERHYSAQIQRYYAPRLAQQLHFPFHSRDEDPPF